MRAHIDMNQSPGEPPRSIRPHGTRAGAAVLLAALADPAAGDECCEYRPALALEDAVNQTVSTNVAEAKNAVVGNLVSADFNALTAAAEVATNRAHEAATHFGCRESVQ